MSPASPVGGYRVLPCSDPMIRMGRPWILLLLLMGPRSSSLLHSTRSNEIVIQRRHTSEVKNLKKMANPQAFSAELFMFLYLSLKFIHYTVLEAKCVGNWKSELL
jgi:hypothetical protein